MQRLFVCLGIMAAVLLPALASAHVVVKPAQVGIGSFQTFTTGVPNEKDQAVTAMRLMIPAGLTYVSPTVKPGWTIDIKKSGDGEEATVTEISWTGGTIPAGQRDDFGFSAQVPATETTLAWKAYQTYADGTVVAWDETPNGKDEEGSTPYSETKVVNDLADASTTTSGSSKKADAALALSIVALALSGFVLTRKRQA